MLPLLAPILFLTHHALATPLPSSAAADATVGKLRGVQDPIYHLYLQANPKNASTPVMGPESSADTFTISTTIQSQKTSMYLNVGNASSSYKPLVWGSAAVTQAWGLEGDTVITTTGSSFGRQLNFLACKSTESGYYDLFLQTGSDTPSGKSCSNYQTIHLPCLC